MSLLNLSSKDDGDDGIASWWPRVKEVFSWAAQHPALLGVAFMLSGAFIRSTRVPAHIEKRVVTRQDPYVPFKAIRSELVDVLVPSIDGLDIPIWILSTDALKSAIQAGTGLAASLATSAAATGFLNAILPQIGSVPIAIIPAALLQPDLRRQYPDQSVYEISFRTSILGSLVWPELPPEHQTRNTTLQQASPGVVLLHLSDVLIMGGLTAVFGGAIPSLLTTFK